MLIYQLPLSLYSFKLRLALRLKDAEVELRAPPGGTYRSQEYRAINPAGTIPALVAAEGLLAESDAIIEYLDDAGVGRTLRPADPWRAARHRMLSRWCDMQLEPAVRRLFPHVGNDGRSAAVVAEIDAVLASRLASIESEIDAAGPFAVSAAPGLADCGLTATLAWLTPLGEALRLSSSPGPRMVRVAAAMAAHPKLMSDAADYDGLVAAWIASKR
jgi:glutathione S-transferase